MGEVFVQRDEAGRVLGVTVHDVNAKSTVGSSVFGYLETVATSLVEYLHVPVVGGTTEDFGLAVERTGLHLDRELDAILETLVIGLRILEKSYPSELVVHEATVGVEV